MKYDGKNAEELIKRELLNKEYMLSVHIDTASTEHSSIVKAITINHDILSLFIPSSTIEFYVFTPAFLSTKHLRFRVKEL